MFARSVFITTIERQICASLNRCKRMKAEPNRQIPHKLATKLELVLLQYFLNRKVWTKPVRNVVGDNNETNIISIPTLKTNFS